MIAPSLLGRLAGQLDALVAILREAGDAELVARVAALTPEQARRSGVHGRFGEMDVAAWIEFFLVHEAHHLYVVMLRLAEARHAGVLVPGRK